ncbi:hypothetical protein PG996_010754 [Apiospora saccharicola]|uniref:Uncharacterized protein n=1 Tax=Apiospora saccharicola TaxID=335842 RepID=A0ABR1UPI6_9PEZI
MAHILEARSMTSSDIIVAATNTVIIASLHRITSRRLLDKSDKPENRLLLLFQTTFPMAVDGISNVKLLIEASRQSSILSRSSSIESRPTEDSDGTSIGNSKSVTEAPRLDCGAINGAKVVCITDDCSMSNTIN